MKKELSFPIETHPVTGEPVEGDELTFELDASWQVCLDCQGRGTTYLGLPANQQPSYSAEDFDREGHDFQDNYISGRYDKKCPECKGRTTILEVDWESVDFQDPIVKAYLEHQKEEANDRAVYEMERRMGA